MKPVFRLWIVLWIALLVIAPAMMTTRAQGELCLPGLQPADCELMTAAGKGSITSFVMDYALKVNVSGIEGLKSGAETLHDIALNVAGNGPFGLDTAKLPTDAKPGDLASLLKSIPAITLGNAIKIDLKNGDQPQSFSLEFRILDSKLYFKSDNPDFYKNNQNLLGKWIVAPLDSKALGQAAGSSGLSGAMMGGAMTGGSNAAQMQAMARQFAAVPGFINATRADANDEATFTINIDVAALLKSQEFKPMLRAMLASRRGGGKMDDKQLDAMIAMAIPYFENLKVTVTSVVGTKDQLTHGFGLHIALKLTAEQMRSLAALGGGSNLPEFKNPLDADINFSIKLSNLNQPVKLDAPADAVPAEGGKK